MTVSNRELQKLYWNQKMSQSDIDRHLNQYSGFAEYWLKKFNIPRRGRAEAVLLKKPDYRTQYLKNMVGN